MRQPMVARLVGGCQRLVEELAGGALEGPRDRDEGGHARRAVALDATDRLLADAGGDTERVLRQAELEAPLLDPIAG